MNEVEKYEKVLEVILSMLGILSGHFEDILNIVHAFNEDPSSIDLDELERKLQNLKPLPEE